MSQRLTIHEPPITTKEPLYRQSKATPVTTNLPPVPIKFGFDRPHSLEYFGPISYLVFNSEKAVGSIQIFHSGSDRFVGQVFPGEN